MATPKVLPLVKSCGKCPHYSYYSGGTYKCSATDEIVLDEGAVAPFCPLADYPSRIMADMETTITVLRTPHKYGAELTLLSHIATKLKTNLHARGSSILINLKNGGAVGFDLNYIKSIEVNPFVVRFMYQEKMYKLVPDINPPQLYQKNGEVPDVGELWRQLEIAC